MINKKIVIKDDYGMDFEIIDLISFKNHLTESPFTRINGV